jgi:hypothetical protein
VPRLHPPSATRAATATSEAETRRRRGDVTGMLLEVLGLTREKRGRWDVLMR